MLDNQYAHNHCASGVDQTSRRASRLHRCAETARDTTRLFVSLSSFSSLHCRHDAKVCVEWPIESLVGPIDRSIAVAADSVPVAHTVCRNYDRVQTWLTARRGRLQQSNQDSINRVTGLISECPDPAPRISGGWIRRGQSGKE